MTGNKAEDYFQRAAVWCKAAIWIGHDSSLSSSLKS